MSKISIGSVLGDYTLDAPLGRGGFGFVFKVSSQRHSLSEDKPPADLALKIASPRIDESAFLRTLRSSTDVPRYDAKGLYFATGSCSCKSVDWHELPNILWDEFSMLETLRHINCDLSPRAYEFYAGDDACYYVMEYIDGQDFRSILASKSTNNSKLWIEQLHELLVSLASIKEKYYYFFHGDIKPENIIVDGSGRMRLIDPALTSQYLFGVDRTITVSYNPFALTGIEADTFAIATIIIEMILGRHPFAHLDHPLIFYLYRFKNDDKLKEMAKYLQINDFSESLPYSIRQVLLDWLLKPVSYDAMLKKWHLLSDNMLYLKNKADKADKTNIPPFRNFCYRYPVEFRVNAKDNDGTISEGIVLGYHPEEELVLVGFGTGRRGLNMKYFPPEDLKMQLVEYSGVTMWIEKTTPYEIGSEILIRRHSGAVENGVVVEYTTTGKYIKVVTTSKTWKWFPREVLEELQKQA